MEPRRPEVNQAGRTPGRFVEWNTDVGRDWSTEFLRHDFFQQAGLVATEACMAAMRTPSLAAPCGKFHREGFLENTSTRRSSSAIRNLRYPHS